MERKLATVLFVDLVGSTALVRGADPEVVRRRVQTFFDHVSQCVTTHGGIVEKFAGDAVMAAFGIPQAHEDDAERAVRAALGILDAVARARSSRRASASSRARSSSTTPTRPSRPGEAVNVAARLQQAAEPNEILIGPAAQRLTLGRVELETLARSSCAGSSQPLWAWRALCARAARPLARRPSRRRSSAATPSSSCSQNTYERALRDRRAHLFTIYGEPGVGKSRLAREFADDARGRDRARRPLPALRRGRHVLAARRDGQVRGGHRGRRPARRRDREAARVLRGRGRRRPARARRRACSRPSRPTAASRRSPGRRASGPSARAGAAARAASSRTSTGPRSRCSS